MPSSYRVIKNNEVINQGSKGIVTENASNIIRHFPQDDLSSGQQAQSYENLAQNIIGNAKREAEEIRNQTMYYAQGIKEEALKQGQEEGYQAGFSKGYEEAYTQNIEIAKKEAEAIISNANNLLFAAKTEYENYLQEKHDQIIKLAVSIAQKVLKREVESDEGINEMVYAALENSTNSKSIIIKTNFVHVDNIKAQILDWKERLGLKNDVFVVPDNSIAEGNAVIEKNDGKIVIGIDTAMKNIKDEIF
ncbi:hypothetical protein IAI10_08295 [Clostridium sp. 19966]|uniref:FliH/SctL family protein n=1 Tax=Clostridium sp. 19966 TaxID=2768166 RepID=UPI0028DEE870|nr:FliH/SctL family protein [Clostridium sp. 19966]MDT8716655.1 hypothetical protein [Clostridium sp. 19966]